MSSLKLFFTLGIFLLFVLGLGVAWWLWKLPSQPSEPYLSGDSSLPVVPDSVPPNESPSSSAQKIPDIDTAYTALFSKLLAHQIVFVPVRSTEGSTGSIYQLYEQDITEAKNIAPDLRDFPIMVAFNDLNEDGVLEVFAYESLPGTCGTAGCPLDVYVQQDATWKKIFNTLTAAHVGISNAYVNGYADLFLASGNTVSRYSWNGTEYTQGDTVAAWDGTQFLLKR
jgi:hypothetical protein